MKKSFPFKSILALTLLCSLMAFTPAAKYIPAVIGMSVVGFAGLVLFPSAGKALGVLNPSQITWNGKEVMAMNEAIFESTFVNPGLDEIHTIVTNIVAKQQIAYLGLLGLVGKKGQGCDPESDTASATMSEKFWDPEEISMRLEECYKTYDASFFVWSRNKGIAIADLTNTDVMNFIEERAGTALDEAKLRHAWFGDKDAATTTDSPAGVITPGTDLDFFNAIDGFWKQIYAIVADNSDIQAATISRNAQASYANQKFTAGDVTNKVVMGYMQEILDEADERLTDRNDIMFVVTKSVYDQLKREYKSYGNVADSFMMNINGIPTLTYDGVPVRKFSFWDRMIKAYQNDGTKWYQPHRILLTTKANLQIGVESEEALGRLEVFYDKKSENNYIVAKFKMDAKVVEDYMLSVGY